MRAAVVERYGPPEVARVAEVPVPRCGPDEVLVRVHAAVVSSGDARIRGARFPAGFALPARLGLGWRGPRRRVLGVAFSGVVEAVGDRVADDLVGQVGVRVAGLNGARMGGHAELVAVRPGRLAPVPDGVDLADAAAVLFGGTTAAYFLDRAEVVEGSRVLVVGAAGEVGVATVQLAHLRGAVVTAVCSTPAVDLVRGLGAERVLDRTRDDLGAAGRHDVVVDTVGALDVATGRGLLAPGGRLVLVAATLGQLLRGGRGVVTGTAAEGREPVARLLEQLAAGRLRPVHDSAFPLERVADAYARVDTGRKVGTVLLRP